MSRLDALRATLAAGRAAAPRLGRLGGAVHQARGAIGLHWSEEALHLVQMAHGSAGPSVVAAARVPLSGPEGVEVSDFTRAVRAALRAGDFRGRRIVTTLEPPGVKLMVLDYAGGAGSPEAAILRLVEERIGEPASEMVVDYLPIRALGESTGQSSALVAVASRERVLSHLEKFRGAGLEVDALEITPVAIRRLISDLVLRGSAEENVLALYAGRRRGHLILLWGRRLVLYREIDSGAASAEERLGKALDLAPGEAAAMLRKHGVAPPKPGEAMEDPAGSLEVAETIREILKPSFYQLADEIERARVYTASRARGAAPERALLLGALADWPGADRLLESVGGLPVTRLDLASRLGAGAGQAASVAAGLALRGMLDDG